ncbi:DegT/DnrJ/EryC1/StrS family aminotransferase [Candidatus Parcubacteria bacterium]|nr:DegT/DnrJ/EryC1/StrS family aminotransferase [Patescibacteria group bacterium]MBU4466512.1 DegT/DnrJ/EryC1/StrS family aminotransferase [Patescibacteria group bacterium]MCG2688792.1 DegT/DnrJ/EryC1/StrS family aminotransferase [Candidatus Parcubacteria bacterium]
MKTKYCQDRPIFTSLSPNTEKDDIVLALKLIFQPWKWTNNRKSTIVENPLNLFEQKFKDYLGAKYAFTFNSGRTAFLAILKCLTFEPDSEVLIQGFTCNAVVNPILAADLKPVFVDIEEETLNINPDDLEKKITDKSKVVLVQHTFGLPAFAKAASFAEAATKAESAGKPADVSEDNKIVEICKKHNLILIEDCAHSLGATYNEKKLGTFGTAAFFSFGRDKVISSVFGGMAITNDEELAKRIGEYRDKLPEPSYFWIFQQLLHPILTNFLVIPFYNFCGLGKWMLILLQKLKILSKAVQNKEKKGEMPANFTKKMPEALAILALNQFDKLNKILAHQKEIAGFYRENLKNTDFSLPPDLPGRIYMRYSLLLKDKDTDKILKKARKQKIFLDDGWRKTAIVPPDTNQKKLGYRAGDCPIAEKIAENIINLPTHINISKKDAKRIIDFLKTKHTEARPL